LPLYDFYNKNTDEVFEKLISIAGRETYLAENPHISQVPSAPMLVTGQGERLKTDGGMGDILGRIARANPTSPLADTYGDKGITATKIRQVVKKNQSKHGISISTD
jgi:hypothetical protein